MACQSPPFLPVVPDLAAVEAIIARCGRKPQALIPILQAIQDEYHYLPLDALRHVCLRTEISPAVMAGVATFYAQFRHQPCGKHLVRVCHGTACHVKGSELVDDAIRRHLKIAPGQDTDPARQFTLERIGCLGCCTLAPVVRMDEITYGHVRPDTAARSIQDFLETGRDAEDDGHMPAAESDGERTEIRIGIGSCCIAGGSLKVRHALEHTLHRIGASAVVKPVGCVGMCHQTPLVEVVHPSRPAVLYTQVTVADVPGILHRHFRPRGAFRRMQAAITGALDRLLVGPTEESAARYAADVRDGPICSFLDRQQRLATEHSGHLEPLDLAEYRANNGFGALQKVLAESSPAQVIDAITRSGLRGRGGAGYPTGKKWAAVRAAPGALKYVLCNGDEGDPGAFMDRMILESYPFRVLEGMTIAALAVGAKEGYLYIRHEYPLAVERIRQAILLCEKHNLLGDNILGSKHSLHLRVMEGAGAFVCGEETALIASLEGRRGMPRLRPPFPAQEGLWGRPTCINNVETYALVPWIMRHGAEAFADIGTATSKGTKVFALTGKVARGGLIEVPLGITIRQIVEEIGGGVAPGRTFKAVQIGGPSGGCIPAALANTPVDYESLTAAGAIMGSGGLVVLDDRDCLVDMARYFLQFAQAESCGKCSFCRIGTRKMLDILDRLCTGQGRRDDLATLQELSEQVKKASLCGLGQTAPNPVLTTLRYFREEYEAHLQGRCPAGRCKTLIKYEITERCIGCTKCAQICPTEAIAVTPYQQHVIDPAKCTRCDMCRGICPEECIVVR